MQFFKLPFLIYLLLVTFGLQATEYTHSSYKWTANPVLHDLNEEEEALSSIVIKENRILEYIYKSDDVLYLYKTVHKIVKVNTDQAIEMFNKVNVPIMGVVENMAVHQCSQCGHSEHIFGEGGGERIAKDYGTQLLGALPLALSIREDADSGKPSVVADPDSAISQQYIDVAQKAAATNGNS